MGGEKKTLEREDAMCVADPCFPSNQHKEITLPGEATGVTGSLYLLLIYGGPYGLRTIQSQ